jgi:hypothetical protein
MNNKNRIIFEQNLINEIIKFYPQEYKDIKEKNLIIGLSSLRFFPHWSPTDIDQITGLIEMMNYINEIDNSSKNMIEIGTFLGESATIFLAYKNINKLYCIDNFWESEKIKSICKKRLANYIANNRCEIIEDKSENVLLNIEKPIHIVYIDGSHSFKDVLYDLETSYKLLEQNGFLCGHDYKNDTLEVKNAVNFFMEKYNIKNIKIFVDSSWCIKKI